VCVAAVEPRRSARSSWSPLSKALDIRNVAAIINPQTRALQRVNRITTIQCSALRVSYERLAPNYVASNFPSHRIGGAEEHTRITSSGEAYTGRSSLSLCWPKTVSPSSLRSSSEAWRRRMGIPRALNLAVKASHSNSMDHRCSVVSQTSEVPCALTTLCSVLDCTCI